MSDVFQEVDEELKRRKIDQIARRYGPWVGSVVALIIAVFAGYTFWQNYQESRLAAAGDQLVAGMELVVAGQNNQAAEAFAALAADAPGGYRLIALFQEATARRLAGDLDASIALYDQIAGDESTPSDFRDLARLFSGLAVIGSNTGGYDDIESRLGPVAAGSSPWRYHALEALGFSAYRVGSYGLAASHYRQITDDALAPIGVASRATEMLNLTDSIASAD